MKKIPLTQGKFALVDDEDFEELSKYKWYYSCGYARRTGPRPRQERIYMHRTIMNPPKDKLIDHINHDTLDNRKNNLRISTKSTNGMNRGKNKNNSSGYKGVHFKKDKNKWCARITIERKIIFLGYFNNPLDASLAYNNAAINIHKDFASI